MAASLFQGQDLETGCRDVPGVSLQNVPGLLRTLQDVPALSGGDLFHVRFPRLRFRVVFDKALHFHSARPVEIIGGMRLPASGGV